MSPVHVRWTLCLAVIIDLAFLVASPAYPAASQDSSSATAPRGEFFVPARSPRTRVTLADRASAPLIIGLVIGGGAGALIGTGDDSEWKGLSIAAGAVTLGALGLGVGALIGHSVARENWEEVPPANVRVGPGGNIWIPAPAGLRVRVTAPAWKEGRWTGTAARRSGDSFLLVRGGREMPIPSEAITKVEATWSKRSFGSWGALVGFAGGMVAGAFIHASSQDASAVSLGLALGLPGALVCSLVAKQVRVPRWEEVPLDPPPLEPVPGAAPAPSR